MFVVLSSCGGDEFENINYTKYNISSASASGSSASISVSNSATKNSITSAKVSSTNQNTEENTKTANNQAYAVSKPNNKQKAAKSNTNIKSKTKKIVSKIEAASHNISSFATTGGTGSYAEKSTTTQPTATATTTLAPLKDTDIAYITANGDRFHRKNCRYLYKSSIEIIVADAKEQGYTPCSVCKPQ